VADVKHSEGRHVGLDFYDLLIEAVKHKPQVRRRLPELPESRMRTVKPEFWTSEQVVECSPNARLLFIGLWNFCDDSGIHPAATKRLKRDVFPADNFWIRTSRT
jgi:hypothetical protein